jgi:hypothetical protein
LKGSDSLADSLTEEEIYKLINELGLQPDTVEEGNNDYNKSLDLVSIENNTIKVSTSTNGGLPAIIKASAPVIIKKNGQPMNGEFPISAEDQLEWEIEKKPLFHIEVSEDHMQAWLQIHSKKRYCWKLRDKPPANKVVIEAEEDTNTIIETLQIADIMKALNDKSIMNIEAHHLIKEMDRPTNKPVVIAQGIYPVPSRDARVELYFNEQIESSFEEINGTVDYRNHMRIPCAQIGEVVARKFPLEMGKPGSNIFGQIVEPTKPKDIIMLAKSHVRITPEGEVIALKEGRPRMTGGNIRLFDMSTFHIVAGDVDLETGNIVFSGDVIVYGNVTDGMIVEALGNVSVLGNVYNATITATGSICVKGNVIGSQLYSGHYGVLFNRLYNYSKKLYDQLRDLNNAVKHLRLLVEAQGKSIPVGQCSLMLIESKFKEIPNLIKENLVCIANIQQLHKGHLNDLKEKLNVLMQPWTLLNVTSPAFLDELQHMLIEAFETIKRSAENIAQTDIPQCHLTKIMSNGDILIRREGVLQSHLFSKRNIVFYHKDAVCRGSHVEAENMISAMNVGGQSGGETTLVAGKKIIFNKMYYGRIFIQRFSKEILEPMEETQFYVKDNCLITECHDDADRGIDNIEI